MHASCRERVARACMHVFVLCACCVSMKSCASSMYAHATCRERAVLCHAMPCCAMPCRARAVPCHLLLPCLCHAVPCRAVVLCCILRVVCCSPSPRPALVMLAFKLNVLAGMPSSHSKKLEQQRARRQAQKSQQSFRVACERRAACRAIWTTGREAVYSGRA